MRMTLRFIHHFELMKSVTDSIASFQRSTRSSKVVLLTLGLWVCAGQQAKPVPKTNSLCLKTLLLKFISAKSNF